MVDYRRFLQSGSSKHSVMTIDQTDTCKSAFSSNVSALLSVNATRWLRSRNWPGISSIINSLAATIRCPGESTAAGSFMTARASVIALARSIASLPEMRSACARSGRSGGPDVKSGGVKPLFGIPPVHFPVNHTLSRQENLIPAVGSPRGIRSPSSPARRHFRVKAASERKTAR